ncbi:hypothetical protein HYPSUDRAFT_48285 [Hypholoma sublateritium FD-334 SS-4]|uniref:Transmembrane protein n=1 Tax=Hypholoma sublateritium (strain FD-334 SS-4) TaxID=945553 RepID=A0A0D2LXA8_HYPSF|nr:hypothetical protein HYPSUDRAFT_48285 [Hypholoma sublateritium FD-334 SS-4]
MTLNLRANLPVDDSDSHFAYSTGDWSTLAGSTRQFEGSVHVTNNVGATVAFAYQGQGVVLYATIPGGATGNVAIDVSIDGGSPQTFSATPGSSNVYMDALYQSPTILEFATHTVVVTNKGSASFMFDEAQLFSNDINPSMVDPPVIAKSTTTSQAPTNTTPAQAVQPTSTSISKTSDQSTQSVTTSGTSKAASSPTIITEITTTSISTATSPASSSPTSSFSGTKASLAISTSSTTVVSVGTSTFLSTDSAGGIFTYTNLYTTSLVQSVETGIPVAATSRAAVPIGAIIGIVFGGLAFLFLALLVFLCARRRTRSATEHALLAEKAIKPLAARPFRLSARLHPSPSTRTLAPGEKAALRAQAGEEQGGPSSIANADYSSGSDISPSGDYTYVHNATSSSNLLMRRPSEMATDVGAEMLRRASMTTSSSMYASPISGRREDGPPPYQPSIAARMLDPEGQVQYPNEKGR